MNILRRSGLVILAAILSISLLGLAWSHAFQTTIRDKNTVKSWLEESGFYDKTVDIVVDNIAKNSQENGANLPKDDPKLHEIANDSFTPDYLKQITEEVLNGTYGWLEGKTDGPEFSVDLTEVKSKLVDGVSEYAASRAASLPACSAAQSAQMAKNGSFDTWNATCLPRGLTPEKVGQQIKTEMLTSEDFLKDTEFNGEDIKVTLGDGKTVPIGSTEQSKNIQDAYKWTAFGPTILGVLTLLSAVGIFFISSEKHRGIRRIGGIMLGNGIVLAISYLVVSRLGNVFDYIETGNNSDAKELVSNFVGAVSSDLGRIILIYAVAMLIVGIACLLSASMMNRNNQPKSEAKTIEQPTDKDIASNDSTPLGRNTTTGKPKTPPKIQL